MTPKISIKGAFLLIALSIACSKNSGNKPLALVTKTYTESEEDFPNPERGFYQYSVTKGSDYSPLSENELKGYRSPTSASGANYAVVSTLVFRYFILDAFKNVPLSDDYLHKVKADFSTARAAGMKIIARFTYTNTTIKGSCKEGFICPPYGDAPKNTILMHIEQLKPLLHDNTDVIACLQMGFIGVWGEQYYTDHFGDASSNDQQKLFDNNWKDRMDVLKALLDSTPDDMMIQIRYPQHKQRYIYGVDALVDSAPLTEDEAFSKTDKARIGYHNDCFLASSDDYGTYEDYGNSRLPRTSANSTLRKYLAADSKYVVVGGETCSDDYSPQSDCEPAGIAEKEMRDFHYSFLNTNYNNEVNNDWVTGGCMDNIKRKLGYRIVLKNGKYPSQVNSGDSVTISLELTNIGYASPYKARPVQLVLKNKESHDIVIHELSTDIRKWFTGTIRVTDSFAVNAPSGEWDLYLNLPDQNTSINTRPEYSIRLANEAMWEQETGYNNLNHTLIIN